MCRIVSTKTLMTDLAIRYYPGSKSLRCQGQVNIGKPKNKLIRIDTIKIHKQSSIPSQLSQNLFRLKYPCLVQVPIRSNQRLDSSRTTFGWGIHKHNLGSDDDYYCYYYFNIIKFKWTTRTPRCNLLSTKEVGNAKKKRCSLKYRKRNRNSGSRIKRAILKRKFLAY